jgi:hypothetical protein
MSDRISEVNVTTGDRPLSGGLDRDAELIEALGVNFVDEGMTLDQLRGSLRQLAHRLRQRASQARDIEDAAKYAAGRV